MRSRTLHRLYFFGVTFLCSVALMMVSFAHAFSVSEPRSPELTAYLALGGNLSDICLSSDPDAPQHTSGCDACIVKSGFALTRTDWSITACPVSFVAMADISADIVHASDPFDPARASRAPPV